MAGPDEVMDRISETIALSQRGDRAAARERFARIWAEISPGSDAFHRCVLAHYMADLRAEPHDELAWDLRALEEIGRAHV